MQLQANFIQSYMEFTINSHHQRKLDLAEKISKVKSNSSQEKYDVTIMTEIMNEGG